MLPHNHEVSSEVRKKILLRSLCSLIRFWREIKKFKSCRVWSCFLRNFIVAKKSKNVEIVFSIPKAKSESISIKIRQPLFWTDPYLPDLAWGAKKKGWKVQILLAIIDLLIYILKVLCSYLQHLLLFRSPVFKKQEFRSQQPICHCTAGLKNRIPMRKSSYLSWLLHNITRNMGFVIFFSIK